MNENNQKFDEKSCGIVLFREQNHEKLFLVLHYLGGHWDFPKGHIEAGENEHQTAMREVLEETGIRDVKFLEGFREEVSYKYRKRKQLSNKQVVFFLGKTKTSSVKISDEHFEYKWLPYDAAFNRLTFDNAKGLLKKAKKVFV